jgi:hypothetical protein
MNSADYLGHMRSFGLAVIVALAASGCSIIDFDVNQPIPTQSVQGSNIPTPLAALFPLPLSLDLSSKIKAMNTGPINSITLSSLELTITMPTDHSVDWSFVDHVDVFVESTKSGTALPKAKIATVSMPTGQKMTFVVDGSVNLKPYVDEGSQVDSSGSGHAPASDMSYDGLGVFTVHPL